MTTLTDALLHDEGIRLKPYVCTAGKTTIGIGRNLTDKGISKDEAHLLLANDINEIVDRLKDLPWYNSLSQVRKDVIVNMAFNLGFYGVCSFRHMILAIECSDYMRASQEMLNSAWAKQVGKRAVRLAKEMETNTKQELV